MADEQLRLDFTRGEQLALLRDVRIPKEAAASLQVKPAAVKHLLTRIAEYAGAKGSCFATQETLSETTELGIRTIRRAIRVLEQLSLIACERRKVTRRLTINHYWIVWNELASLRDRQDKQCQSEFDEASTGQSGPLIESYQPAKSVDQPASSAYQPAKSVVSTGQTGRFLEPLLTEREPSTNREPDWQAVEKKYSGKLFKIKELVQQARSRGETPAAFVSRAEDAYRVATAECNRSIIKTPDGTVSAFLERGCWPDARIKTPEFALIRVSKDLERDQESRMNSFFYVTVTTGRMLKLPESQIREQMLTKMSENDLRKRGWS